MERKVIFRDRQEGRADDPNNIQLFADESLQSIVTQAITPERMFYGGGVSKYSATEIQIAPIWLWVGDQGRIYRHTQTQTLSIFSHLPLQDKRWLAVSVMGQEQDTDLQPRDFKIDLQTGQLEPRTVAMERAREVVVEIKAGLESPDPQVPLPTTGYTAIANVLLNSSGIVEIIPSETAKLMRLFEVWQSVLGLLTWKAKIESLLDSLSSDLAETNRRIGGMANHRMLMEVAASIAEVKERLNMPDDYSSFGADHFLTPDETDLDHPLSENVRIEEGVRFAWETDHEQVLELFNPYDRSVMGYEGAGGGGVVLPAYTEMVTSKKAAGHAGSISIGQYDYTTHTFKQGTHTRTVTRYGPTRVACTNSEWWKSGEFDPFTGIFKKDGETWEVSPFETEYHGNVSDAGGYTVFKQAGVRLRQIWTDTIEEPYWYVMPENKSISGSQVAQTLLMGRNGWLVGVDLFFDEVDTNGDVSLSWCETVNGVPNPQRCIGFATISPQQIKKYPNETTFRFPNPIFVEAGKRYAMVLTTLGSHKLVQIDGTYHTAGTLFVTTDGSYFDGDLQKDLMFGFRYAKFSSNRTVVRLKDISATSPSGIADLELWTEGVEPVSCDFYLEFQRDGDPAWRPMVLDHASQLTNRPSTLRLQAVFVGTADLAPGIHFTNSTVRGRCPKTGFTHISTDRILNVASSDVTVTLRLEGWNYNSHECRVKLLINDVLVDPEAPDPGQPEVDYVQRELDAEVIERIANDDGTETLVKRYTIERTFSFQLDEPVASYRIHTTGAVQSPIDIFHVAGRVDIAR